MKTTMAANRGDNILTATSKVWSRGGVLGFYQGLIPWVRRCAVIDSLTLLGVD